MTSARIQFMPVGYGGSTTHVPLRWAVTVAGSLGWIYNACAAKGVKGTCPAFRRLRALEAHRLAELSTHFAA